MVADVKRDMLCLVFVFTHSQGPIYVYGLSLITTRIINYIQYDVWDEITYPFPNFNGKAAEVWDWINNFTPHSIMDVIT